MWIVRCWIVLQTRRKRQECSKKCLQGYHFTINAKFELKSPHIEFERGNKCCCYASLARYQASLIMLSLSFMLLHGSAIYRHGFDSKPNWSSIIGDVTNSPYRCETLRVYKCLDPYSGVYISVLQTTVWLFDSTWISFKKNLISHRNKLLGGFPFVASNQRNPPTPYSLWKLL